MIRVFARSPRGSQRVRLPVMAEPQRAVAVAARTQFTLMRRRTGTSVPSLGFGPGASGSGRTKQEVRDKLKALHTERNRGLGTSAAYTVQKTVDDWLQGGLPGRSERTRSVYQEALAPLMGQIGAKPLRELTAGDVRHGLEALGDRLSTRARRSPRLPLPGQPGTPRRTTSWGWGLRSLIPQGCGRAAQPVADS